MPARFYADLTLSPGDTVSLPDQAARHVQVLRLQPGEHITLFNGRGDGITPSGSEGEFDATIAHMGRSEVRVTIGDFTATAREASTAVHLALGIPANERMDWLIEKATELGAASIQPLMSERSVLRVKADRADKKLAHWRAVATAACEQCGRNRLPVIHEVASLGAWLRGPAANPPGTRLLLSLQAGSQPLASFLASILPSSSAASSAQSLSERRLPASTATPGALTFLSGPEGGLSASEEAAALDCGFLPVSLGSRVLRAETAPLACLSLITLQAPP